jgi:RimJ/RimL family protein N-acetyltransferase
VRCVLREVRDEDLPVLFEQWADPVAVHMAAFTAPDHMDRDAFERRWSQTTSRRDFSRPIGRLRLSVRLSSYVARTSPGRVFRMTPER